MKKCRLLKASVTAVLVIMLFSTFGGAACGEAIDGSGAIPWESGISQVTDILGAPTAGTFDNELATLAGYFLQDEVLGTGYVIYAFKDDRLFIRSYVFAGEDPNEIEKNVMAKIDSLFGQHADVASAEVMTVLSLFGYPWEDTWASEGAMWSTDEEIIYGIIDLDEGGSYWTVFLDKDYPEYRHEGE